MQPTSLRVRLISPVLGTVFSLILSAGAAAAAASDVADAPVSGEIAVTSDYVYRGLSFSDAQPAVQASVTWAPVAGLHADGWASSVDFGPGDPTDAELSATLGYEFETGSMTFDAGVTYIAYAGAPRGGHYDYVEIYGAARTALGGGDFTGALHYSPRYSGDVGPALFSDIEGSWPLGSGMRAVAVVGHAHLDPAAGADYAYWQAGLAVEAIGLTFDLRYHGNSAHACNSPCADRVALTILKAF